MGTGRKVIIYKPARTASQQGGGKVSLWQIKYINAGAKWNNPLMGWTSTRDPQQALNEFNFASKEAAIDWAERQGLVYEIEPPKEPKRKPKSYSTNFGLNGKPTGKPVQPSGGGHLVSGMLDESTPLPGASGTAASEPQAAAAPKAAPKTEAKVTPKPK